MSRSDICGCWKKSRMNVCGGFYGGEWVTADARRRSNRMSSLQHTSHSNGRSDLGTRSSRTGVRTRSSDESQPPHVGNYRLLKTIGKGNFAKVKLARHILTGREVSFPERELLQKVDMTRCLDSGSCFKYVQHSSPSTLP